MYTGKMEFLCSGTIPVQVLDQRLMEDAFDADSVTSSGFTGLELGHMDLQAAADLCVQIVGESNLRHAGDFLCNRTYVSCRSDALLSISCFTALL